MSAATWRDRLLIWLCRCAVRPLLALPLPWSLHRAGFELFAPRAPRKDGVSERVERISGVGVRSFEPADVRGTILWLHGGGFVMGSSRAYARLAHGLARCTGYRVILPDYRLAPEHPFPAGLEDCAAVAREVASRGPYALGGDSAGGTLALALCPELLAEGLGPTCLVLASPAADLDQSRPVPPDRDELLLSVGLLRRATRAYLGSTDPGDPRASPCHADFTGAPPVLIQVAERELLEQDSDRIAGCLRAAGGQVALDRETGVPHVWQMFVGITPKATRAVDRIAAFVLRHGGGA